ncbi:hypothetical protein [Dysgonomonas sp. 511]|uniref:hypothetical protein n=1 Tax=Dysgonomonas sp. 511 TaxID=2302930 RepID=UPI0013D4F0EB|nr:hypothetical protein [Dysgonomonas sp. 511]NDV79838.1 hypothetical protein [Dysgonomonas sp. 511]
MKKLNKTIFSVIAAFAIIFSFAQCKDAKEAAVTKLLEAQVNLVNSQCPIQLNQAVRVDSCKITEKMTMKTFATMSFVNAADFKSDEFAKMTKPSLVYTIQTNDELKQARELGVIFVYAYNDDAGKLIGEIKIGPDDYNQPIDEKNKEPMASMSTEDIDSMLQKVVSGIKSHLPMKVDQVTTLVDCKALPEKKLEYVYMLEATAKQLGADFTDNVKTVLVENAKANPEMKQMLEAGVTCVYVYNDKDGKEICRLDLDQSDL